MEDYSLNEDVPEFLSESQVIERIRTVSVVEQTMNKELITEHLGRAMKRGVLQAPAKQVTTQQDVANRISDLAESKRFIFIYVKQTVMDTGLWIPSD